jgi:hypothetical protein
MDIFDSNDLPEIEEIMGTQPASHMSPAREVDESNFDFGVFDDMNADMDFTRPYDQMNADSNVGLVSTADENDANEATTCDLNEKIDDASSSQLQKSNRRQALGDNDSTNRRHLFVGPSTRDNAPSEPRTDLDKVRYNTGKTKVHQNDISEFFRPPGLPNPAAIPARPTESSRKSTKDIATIAAEISPANVGDVDEEAGSEDPLEKWVKDMFGTKDFNYIG